MDPVKEIGELVTAAEASISQFDSSKFLEKAREIFDEACKECAKTDPIGDNSPQLQAAYVKAEEFLLRYRLNPAAELLLLEWWEIIGARQLQQSKHVYRANIALQLMQFYWILGDTGAAIRWGLLCQADDLLHHPDDPGWIGGAGQQLLQTALGMTKQELSEFNQVAARNAQIITTPKSDTPKTEWFAEDVVVRFAQDVSFGHLFASPTAVIEFPISKPYLSELLRQLERPASSPKGKGDSLEAVAAYLLTLIPGWMSRRNVYSDKEGPETDVLVSNLNTSGNVAAELLGRHFLVECKNRTSPVNVSDVGYFLYRMRLMHCVFGIVFTTGRVTGKRGQTAAYDLIRQAFHEDGITCIIIERADLDSLASGETKFWPLLLRKIEGFRFGRSRAKSPQTKRAIRAKD